MAQFELSEWIAQPPVQVFAALTDNEKAPDIMPNIVRQEKLTDGPPGVGTRYRETRRMEGKEQQTELEVVAYDAPRRYGVQAAQSGILVTYTYELQPENEGTRVNLLCQVTASGVKKLAAPMVASIMKREDGDHLQQLKAYLE